jgi:hypothetical protein
MGRTKAIVPADETPIDRETLGRILFSTPPEMILIGGQALAFWMMRFGIGSAPSGDAPLADITTDVDFLGSVELALQLAKALNAKLIRPNKSAMTALVGQVRLQAPKGLEYNVDVLRQIYSMGGVKKSIEFTRRVGARASIIGLADGRQLKILHPIDVLESRIQNAAGLLESKGPHVLTQAKWAIKVARHAMELLAMSPHRSDERPGAMASEIYKLATSTAGKKVHDYHQVEVAEAIPFDLLTQKVDGFEKQAKAMIESLHKKGRLRQFNLSQPAPASPKTARRGRSLTPPGG